MASSQLITSSLTIALTITGELRPLGLPKGRTLLDFVTLAEKRGTILVLYFCLKPVHHAAHSYPQVLSEPEVKGMVVCQKRPDPFDFFCAASSLRDASI